MQRITRAQLIQAYEFAPLSDVEQLVADAKSAAQIILAQQGITHAELNPATPPETEEVSEASQGDVEQGQSPAEIEPVQLPVEFPHAKELLAGGVGTYTELAAKTDDDLLAIKGIGKVALGEIRAAQDRLGQATE